MISITKIFGFETAHRIATYKGSCSNIHGHSYKLHVTVTGEIDPETDMIFDFKQLKKIVNEKIIDKLDHATILKEGDKYAEFIESSKLFYMKQEPTAERLLEYFSQLISSELPASVKLIKLILWETETSYAIWESQV